MKDKNKQGKAFFTNGFVFKGANYEALTNGRLGVLIQANSAFINGGQKIKAVYDVAYVLSKSYDKLAQVISNDTFDSEVYSFMDGFDYEDFSELEKLVYNLTEEIHSVMVETRSDEDEGEADGKK